MSHEILSIKLCQLEERMDRLHSLIHWSEAAEHSRLSREIDQLRRECDASEESLREHLQRSQSALVSVLGQGYGQMEQIIRSSKDQLQTMAQDSPDPEAAVEEKLLLAEYALDFAHQAADRALLLAMEAIDAQLQQQEGKSQ